MTNAPFFTSALFIAVTFITGGMFWQASGRNKIVLVGIGGWMLIQALTALSGFYQHTDALPPRVFLQVVPPLLTVLLVFLLPRSRKWLDTFDPGMLTLLHTVRIGAELTIFLLYSSRLMPSLLTFEGRNFDIIAGVSAPFVYFWGYRKQKLHRTFLLLWNFLCLVLLLNVVVHAALAVPTPFQQLGFDQPNVAVLYFPFNWLPSVVVPLVLFSQLICVRALWSSK